MSTVSVSPTWAVPLMMGAPVAGELAAAGPGTVSSDRLESSVPSLVQTASWAAQSSVMGRTTVTAASGVRLDRYIPQVALTIQPLGLGSRAVGHFQGVVPQGLVADGDGLAEGDDEGEHARSVKCLSGASWNSAVSGVTTVAVASLVNVSRKFRSSSKDTRTLMALPTSSATRV